MKKALIVVVIIAVVGLAFILLNRDDTPTPNNTNNTNTTEQTTDTTPTADEQTDEDETDSSVTITYTDSGFSPRTYQMLAGGTVTVRNDSSSDLDFASDDHPVHADNSELNIGVIAPGASETFEITKPGTWGFHNHERDAHTGTITVQ